MIKAYINAIEVKAKLLAMSDKARNRTYQRVLRRAASPVVKDLQRAWAKAKYLPGYHELPKIKVLRASKFDQICSPRYINKGFSEVF